jgi:hypothetical protein
LGSAENICHSVDASRIEEKRKSICRLWLNMDTCVCVTFASHSASF